MLALGAGLSTAVAGCAALESDSEPTPEEPTAEEPTTSPTTDDKQVTTTSETSTRTTTPEQEYAFEQVLDAVDDLGCDPKGESPCDTAIDGAIGDDVAIRFPAGTYRFERSHRFEDFDRLGFVGVGDVSFVPPTGFNDKLLSFLGGWALFSGIDLDVSATGTTAGLRFITRSGFVVEDVEFVGRGFHPDPSVVNALAVAVRNESEQGIVRDIVARRGSAIGHYKGGNGRVGIWVGARHRGRVTIENCHLEEFGNNGIYGSRNPGTVEVVGGLYRNNNVSGVRLGGGGNVVRDTTIEIDLGKYTGPYTATNTEYDTRAIVIEQGPYDKSGRVLIENCEIAMVNADRSQGTIVMWPTGNGPRIEGCEITNTVDWVPGILGRPPRPNVEERHRGIELIDTRITGSSSWGSSVELVGRPGSTISGTTIEQRGEYRNGLRLVESDPCTLESSSITTTQYPVFAFNPQTAGERCIVQLAGETQLERTGRSLESVRSTEIGGTDSGELTTEQPPSGTERRCIGDTIRSEIDSFEGVGITNVEDGTLYWRHHTWVESPSG